MRTASVVTARPVLATASFLNFPRWVVPGGFRHLRGGWNLVGDSGVMDEWRGGSKGADCSAEIIVKFWRDVMSWRPCLMDSASKPTQHALSDWRTRKKRPRPWPAARSAPPSPARRARVGGVPRWVADSFRARGLSRAWKNVSIGGGCGRWARLSANGESWSAGSRFSAAVAYANHGAGRPLPRALLARRIKELEAYRRYAFVALRIAGGDTSVAGALSRVTSKVSGGDLLAGREPRNRFREQVEARCGRVDVDMVARDEGSNAPRPVSRSPWDSAFEGPLPAERLGRFPCVHMIEPVMSRPLLAVKEGWEGPAFCLVPDQPWKRWVPKLRPFRRLVLCFPRKTRPSS